MPTEKIEIKYETIPLGDEWARTIVIDGKAWYHEDDVTDAFFQLKSRAYEQGYNDGWADNDY